MKQHKHFFKVVCNNCLSTIHSEHRTKTEKLIVAGKRLRFYSTKLTCQTCKKIDMIIRMESTLPFYRTGT